MTFPAGSHAGRGQPLERGHRPLGPVFLSVSKGSIEHDDGGDGYRILVVTKESGDDRCDDKDDDHDGGELLPQDHPRASRAPVLQLVGTMLCQSTGGLLVAEPRRRLGAKNTHHLLHLRGVPGASFDLPALIHPPVPSAGPVPDEPREGFECIAFPRRSSAGTAVSALCSPSLAP